MSPELKECESTAMRLSASERAALAERLIESLDLLDDREVESLWIREAEQRYNEFKTGAVSARLASDVLRDARARMQ